MVWHRMVGTALVVAALALGLRLAADEPKKPDPAAKPQSRLEAMAARLGLDDKQKEEITKVHTDFEKKLGDLEHQLGVLRHNEHEAMSKVLTDEQRAKLPAALKAARDKDLEAMAAKLGLTTEQKTKLETVLDEHEKKFLELAAKGDEGRAAFHEVRHAFHEAIGKELTQAQREMLPGLLREEYREWREPETRRAHLKAIGDELGLKDEQKAQLKTIHEDFDKQTKEPLAQLKQTREDEHKAVMNVLTPDQQTKLEQFRKEREEANKKPPAKGADK